MEKVAKARKLLWSAVGTSDLASICGCSLNKASRVRNGKDRLNLTDFLFLRVYVRELIKGGALPKRFSLIDAIIPPERVSAIELLAKKRIHEIKR